MIILAAAAAARKEENLDSADFLFLAALVAWWHVVKWACLLFAVGLLAKMIERGLGDAKSKGKRSAEPVQGANSDPRRTV